MQQPPPPNYGQAPYPNYPPPPRNSFARPLLYGCGAVFALLLLFGSIGAWFAVHELHVAIARSDAANVVAPQTRATSEARHAIAVLQNAQAAAEKAGASAGASSDASPDATQAVVAGMTLLKSFVNGGKTHVDTVPRAVLKGALPGSVESLARSNIDSSNASALGISGTTVSASYGTGSRTVELKVVDAANMSGLTTVMNISMGVVSSEDDEGYERTARLGDLKVHEKWTNATKHAGLLGVIGDRFVVSLDSDGLDMSAAERAFEAIDIAKLTSIAATTPSR